MKITIYELLGLIKEGKAPIIIKYNNYIWRLRAEFNDYFNDDTYLLVNGFDDYENAKDFLNEEAEIIEEDKKIEFEDIKEIDNIFPIYNYFLIINKLIKNQKKLIEEIEKLKGKSE